MRAVAYVYDSSDPGPHVGAVLDRLAERPEEVEVVDAAEDTREAMLAAKRGVGIGSTPDELFDEDGDPDFSAGALVTDAPSGRRSLHVGEAALDALREE